MTTRTCKFGCNVLLGEWNDNARKYHEAASGELHTRERCEEAKANARRTQGANNHNDHGNENQSSSTVKGWIPTKEQADKIAEETKNYVDHTLAGIPQIITIVGESAEEMDDLANSWLRKEKDRIRFKGGQRAYRSHDDKHEITLYFEEIAKQ